MLQCLKFCLIQSIHIYQSNLCNTNYLDLWNLGIFFLMVISFFEIKYDSPHSGKKLSKKILGKWHEIFLSFCSYMRELEMFLSSLPKLLQHPGLGHTKSRWTRCLDSQQLLFRVNIRRKLESKAEPGLNPRHSDTGYRCPNWDLNHWWNWLFKNI